MNKVFVTKGAVPTESASMKSYMKEIKKPKLLSREEEQAVAIAGDVNRLVESNLRFVVQIARQYQGMGLPIEDLIAFGNLGLFEAANRFDPSRNIKFVTFAVWYIRAEITKSLNDMSRTVRIPSHRTKTEEYSTISTSNPVSDDENNETFGERYLAAEHVKSESDVTDFMQQLDIALSNLNSKQEQAIRMNYGIGCDYPYSMKHIAVEMNVGEERARQLVRAAEKNLRKMSGIEVLERYL